MQQVLKGNGCSCQSQIIRRFNESRCNSAFDDIAKMSAFNNNRRNVFFYSVAERNRRISSLALLMPASLQQLLQAQRLTYLQTKQLLIQLRSWLLR